MTRRLLFITATRIGDAVLSTGLLDALLRAEPDLAVTVACGPAPAPLFAGVPGLERVLPMAKRRRGGHWWDLWRATAPVRWHRVVDLRRSLMPWAVLTRHRHTVGADSRHGEGAGGPVHRVVLNAAAIGRADDPPAPRLWTRPEDDATAARLTGGAPVLALAPTANWRGKEWPAERWTALLGPLAADSRLSNARIAVLAGPGEEQAVAPVRAAVPADRLIDLTGGGHPLLTVTAVLARARLFVGNDSGLMHMAVAAGAPVLGLFGPTDERRYGPWGPRAAVVRTPQSHDDWQAFMARPEFDHRTTGSLMADLPVAAVLDAADALLERTA